MYAFNHVDAEKRLISNFGGSGIPSNLNEFKEREFTLRMKFAIITYILHKEHQNAYFSYEPYIREMNIWLNSPKEIIVLAPKICTPPTAIETSYLHNNISFRKIPVISFLNITEVIRSLILFPGICIRIFEAMNEADHIHLRCPGNIGLIACFIQIIFFKKKKTVKYAGNWDPAAKQPLSYMLQRWILSNTFLTRNIRVLVYGDWPGQSKNILPFFTASFSESEIEKTNKGYRPPYKFLFVGNLAVGKQPSFAIQLTEALIQQNISAELHIYGDGDCMGELKQQAKNKSYIHLHGNQPLEVLKQAYKKSHFLILASKSEGWPKVVAEAMFFGCIPIASAVSCVPWMLNYGSRGILIPEGKVNRGQRIEDRIKVKSGEWREDSQHVLGETVDKIIELLKNPEEMKRMSMEAQEWSQEYTLEKFEAEIKKLLVPPDALK